MLETIEKRNSKNSNKINNLRAPVKPPAIGLQRLYLGRG
jgi:hypothetical protein